jgi:hypothetical protein
MTTVKCGATQKWQFLFFCLTFFCLVAKMVGTAKGGSVLKRLLDRLFDLFAFRFIFA